MSTKKVYTLKEMEEKFKNHSVALAAVHRAITQYGYSKKCCLSINSDIVKDAQDAGFKRWDYFCGSRFGKYSNNGTMYIIVEVE